MSAAGRLDKGGRLCSLNAACCVSPAPRRLLAAERNKFVRLWRCLETRRFSGSLAAEGRTSAAVSAGWEARPRPFFFVRQLLVLVWQILILVFFLLSNVFLGCA